jgi:hypothetical protein
MDDDDGDDGMQSLQDPSLRGPEYDFMWNTRPDIAGGLHKLTEIYQAFVISNIM